MPSFLALCEDRYRLASLDLSGFTIYTFMRGFENAMQDFLLEPDRFGPLMDLIMDFECDLMTMAARHGFHGIHFADDWATQAGMIISPTMWRELFKPRYQRQFAHAHALGLHVWYHCCGNLTDIAADFHEIGVDVLNISQPNVVDLDRVSRALRGRQCFMMPISYQTVSIQGTPDDILHEAGTDVPAAGYAHRWIHWLRGRIRLHGHVAGKLSGVRPGLSTTEHTPVAVTGPGLAETRSFARSWCSFMPSIGVTLEGHTSCDRVWNRRHGPPLPASCHAIEEAHHASSRIVRVPFGPCC